MIGKEKLSALGPWIRPSTGQKVVELVEFDAARSFACRRR